MKKFVSEAVYGHCGSMRMMYGSSILVFSCLAIFSLMFSGCDKKGKEEPPAVEQVSVEATSSTTWHYFSFASGKFIGVGEENDASNAEWAARTDWDFAVCKYSIRTNSGEASSKNAKGGVYVMSSDIAFSSVSEVPSGAVFKEDKAVTSTGMSGTVTTVKSDATVIVFKTNNDGSLVMPPVYLKAPVYIFRTADGKGHFKVEFTGYQNEGGKSGYVVFSYAELR